MLCPRSAAGLGELLEGEEAEATQPSPRAAAAAAGAGASQPDALSSAKIRTLIARPHADEAEFAASGGGGGAGPLKSVVFSQFTQFLDLVQPALEAEGSGGGGAQAWRWVGGGRVG